MKVATWNVNSVRARLERLAEWLRTREPDVVCLQETKCEDPAFPAEELRALGYHAACFGQKTYNGVAVLAREMPTELLRGFDDGEDGSDARFIVVRAGGMRIASVYVPNGQAVGSDKFLYKLRWLRRWRRWLDGNARADEPLLMCGDLNVAPEDRDVYDAEAWRDQILCHPEERAGLEEVKRFGLQDLLRLHHPESGLYSWWDYRQLAFPKNRGIRIDHVLGTAPAAARCSDVVIDREARKGKAASDHAPVIATFT